MYRASDEVENERWLADINEIGDRLDLDEDARSRAADLFLSTVPETERSKRAAMAASIYVGALIAGDRRSQGAVADAADVSRLSVQQRWKGLIEEAGLDAPNW
ncbi:MAG: transcription initiation factor IIB family protein [Halorientalis sp.]